MEAAPLKMQTGGYWVVHLLAGTITTSRQGGDPAKLSPIKAFYLISALMG